MPLVQRTRAEGLVGRCGDNLGRLPRMANFFNTNPPSSGPGGEESLNGGQQSWQRGLPLTGVRSRLPFSRRERAHLAGCCVLGPPLPFFDVLMFPHHMLHNASQCACTRVVPDVFQQATHRVRQGVETACPWPSDPS